MKQFTTFENTKRKSCNSLNKLCLHVVLVKCLQEQWLIRLCFITKLASEIIIFSLSKKIKGKKVG